VISLQQFQVAITSLMQILPMAKPLSAAALVMAWDTFPERAKIDLTDEILLYAVQQRVLDPEPPKGLAPHVALLRYVYPVDRTIRRERGEDVTSDQPMVDRGLRRDLAQRMAALDRFHEPGPVRQEQAPPRQPQLPAAPSQWHPDHLSTEQRRAHVRAVASAVSKLRKRGMDSRTWTAAELKQGRRWFEKALQGFWPLEADNAGLAAAWILRNGRWADQLLEAAADGNLKAPPAEAVVASFAGGR
jgi:hypothetical protein